MGQSLLSLVAVLLTGVSAWSSIYRVRASSWLKSSPVILNFFIIFKRKSLQKLLMLLQLL